MIEQLDGRVAVVTGGGGGLGRAMGERFATEGMKVVLADVRPEPLDATVADLRARGLEVRGLVADVSRWDSVQELRDRTLDASGAVHVFGNNAGIGVGADARVSQHDANTSRRAQRVA